MDIRSFVWTPEAPNTVEFATLALANTEVRGYITRLEAAAREQRFSFAVYDTGVLPWASLWCYDAVTHTAFTHCGEPACLTPVGIIP